MSRFRTRRAYKLPGLLKSVRPGDVFFHREFDPTGNGGVYMCVWARRYRNKNSNTEYCLIGCLKLGTSELREFDMWSDTVVQFPWTRN